MMFGIFKHNSDTKEVYQDLKNFYNSFFSNIYDFREYTRVNC